MERDVCVQVLGSHRKKKITQQSNKQQSEGVCAAARGDSVPIVSADSYMMQAERRTAAAEGDAGIRLSACVCMCVCVHVCVCVCEFVCRMGGYIFGVV